MNGDEIDYADQPRDRSLFADRTFQAELRALPPSGKLVAKTLDIEGPLDKQQLEERTLLPGRTVRYALTQLEEAGLVTARITPRDARKRIYALSHPEESED